MGSKKISVTFALPTLLAGGAERVLSFIAKNLNPDKFDVTLLVIGYESDVAYDIEGIKSVFLEKSRVLNGIPPLYNYIRKNKPNIVVSAGGHLNSILAYMSFFFPKTRFVSREVTVLSIDADFFNNHKYDPIAYIANKRFHLFDKIICQSKDMLQDIKTSYHIKNDDKLVVINNPVTDAFKLKMNKKKNHPIRYITVGRLSKEKGIDRILGVLSKLEFPFHYTLIGDGSEKEHIFSLIESYGLSKKVSHIPFTAEVSKYLAQSDLFLQGSHFEGFPNSLIESCSVGTPVVAFKAPGGTKEIIEDGVNGYIVDNEEQFLERLIEYREWNPADVRESVYKKFNSDKILQEYEDLFINLMN